MIPGYLFFSFEEVHVIDSRYFTKDMVAYVRDNKITDILFANNIFKAYSSHTYGSYLRFLHQQWTRPGDPKPADHADSTAKTKPQPSTEKPQPTPEKQPEPPAAATSEQPSEATVPQPAAAE